MTQSKTLRTAVYGFHEPSLAEAIDRLQREKRIEVVHWMGIDSPRRSFDEDIQRWHLQGIPQYQHSLPHADVSPDWFDFLNEHTPQIVDQLQRNPVCERLADSDFSWFIRQIARYFHRILVEKRVEWLILQNLPHEGFELVMYLVARHLGIATLMTYQSILPNRFFYCFDLRDFGWFREVPASHEAVEIDVPPQFQKDLFYMESTKGAKNTRRDPWRLSIQRRIRLTKISLKLWKERKGWYRIRGKAGPRIPDEQRYAWELSRATYRKPIKQPFVYFPLHLQPELSTSAIGDAYRDQIRAIDALAAWIPRSWQVAVKENPKQTHRHREPNFFARLKSLPNVRLLDRSVDTYGLMSQCQFVATVSGTAGWEAITGGKRVVVFGRPWYLTLPGVHHWPPDRTAESIAAESVEHNDLLASLRQLLRKSTVGIVDIAYRASLPEFSSEDNTARIADFIRRRCDDLVISDR